MTERKAAERGATEGAVWPVLGPALASAVGLWMAFPPLGIWPLAWIAPAGWLWLARGETWSCRHPYRWIYLSGALFWLTYLQGIRLAHWALYLGWLALALYLAAYPPLFVALTRWLRERWRWPLPLAGAIVWTALEYFRAFFATGFTGGTLAHSQTPRPELIQLAEWGGPYLVSFVLVLFAGCAVEAVASRIATEPRRAGRWVVWAAVGIGTVLATGVWGTYRIRAFERTADTPPDRSPLRVLLVQESVDTIFEYNEQRNRESYALYRRATLDALERLGPVDLVIWPETVFTENTPELLGGDDRHPELRRRRAAFDDKLAWLARDLNQANAKAQPTGAAPRADRPVSILAGTATVDLDHNPPREFNSALLVDPAGQVVHRYYKNHLVMFGEYIPFGSWLPWLYQVTPMPNGVQPGAGPELMELRGVRLSPSICFENMLPQLFRRHAAALRAAGTPPDAFVNVTNDGWFWGSSILDTHQQAAIFRAVEQRRPLLVAANTGLSAWVAPSGRVVQQGGHRQSAALVAHVGKSQGVTFYQTWGDLPAGACLIVCFGAVGGRLISGWLGGRSLSAAGRRA